MGGAAAGAIRLGQAQNVQGLGNEFARDTMSGLTGGGVGAGVAQLTSPSSSPTGTSTADTIRELSSYGVFDWACTGEEESKILSLLQSDSNAQATLQNLHNDGTLVDLLERVDDPKNRAQLLQVVSKNLPAGSEENITTEVRKLGPAQMTQFYIGLSGGTPGTAGFDRSKYDHLLSEDTSAPFSGVGATGVSALQRDVPFLDGLRMFFGDEATTDRYDNPVGGLDTYLSGLSADDRQKQAELLLNQPIQSIYAGEYGENVPSRAQVMTAAATKYGLDPKLVGAIILAEQRDQSANEDGAEYQGALQVGRNTSIGLGQIVVSTARKHDLLSDLYPKEQLDLMSDQEIARLLTSDEVNIFATAKYLHILAEQGAATDPAKLPETFKAYPGLDLKAYGAPNAPWPQQNIEAIGSEYTSRPWDDRLSTGWGSFVGEAYKDVSGSGSFTP